jgi:hypothetical protein
MAAIEGKQTCLRHRETGADDRRPTYTDAAGMQAVLRHSIDMCRDVHGQHPGEKACKSMQSRTAGRRAVEEKPNREDQYSRNKDSDHVMAKP